MLRGSTSGRAITRYSFGHQILEKGEHPVTRPVAAGLATQRHGLCQNLLLHRRGLVGIDTGTQSAAWLIESVRF
jgi:hypothetical protein